MISGIKYTDSKKTALVTGGVRRLGRQISYFLAEEGYQLALIFNSSSKKELEATSRQLKKLDAKFGLYKCDIGNVSSLKRTIDRIGKDFGKIDLLINNAGIISKVGFGEITPDLFNRTINVNLRAPLFVTQFAVRYLKRSNDPLIINIASLGGLQNWTKYFPYSISKTGVIKLTYLLAKELAPNIRVNAIAPGTIIIDGEEKGTPQKINLDRIPLKKYGKPRDVVAAIRFIINCSYLTGHVVPVDGGRLLN